MFHRKIFIFLVGLLLISCTHKKYIPPEEFYKLTESDYPDVHGVIVFDSTFVTFRADGTGSERTHVFVKIFTTYGKKKYGEVTFSYLDNYDTVIVKYARTIKSNGKVVPVPKANITDRPMPAWEGSVFLIPNLHIVKIVFPEVEPGCAIEYNVEYATKNAPFDSIFDSWYLFKRDDPIKLRFLSIALPERFNPIYKLANGELVNVEPENINDSLFKDDRIVHYKLVKKGYKIYIFEAKNISKVEKELAMPPLVEIAPKLVITTRKSWEDGSRWYYKLCEPNLKPDSEVITLVDSLIKDSKSFDDSVRALYEFVNKKVRYVETKLLGKHGGYEPQDIKFTLRHKYGVCRDKAALLVGLLRAAGIKESYMVLTNPIMDFVDIPALTQANHAIVAIKRNDDWMYLDPTAEYSVEFLTPFESDKPALVCTEKGEPLLRTPKSNPDANKMEILVTGVLDENGTLKQKMIMTGKGVMDMSLRSIFKFIPEEQFKEMMLSGLKSRWGNASIDSIVKSDAEDFSKPMKIEIYITIPDYPEKIGKDWHLESGGNMRISFTGNPWMTESRKYPIELRFTYKSISKTVIKFPKSLKVKSLPEPFNYSNEYVELNTETKAKNHTIISQSEIVFKKHRIPASAYEGLKTMMEKLAEYSKKEIILTKE